MKKYFQKIMLVLALITFTLPAMAGTSVGSKHSKSLMGASAITAVFGGLASIKKSDGAEFAETEKEVLGAIDTLVTERMKGLISQETLEEKLKELNTSDESIKEIKDAIIKLDAQFKAYMEKGGNEEKNETLNSLIAKELESESVKSQLQALYSGNDASKKVQIQVKAATSMTIASNTTNALQPHYNPDIATTPQERNRIYNFVNRVMTSDPNTPSETWLEEYNVQGNASFTAEGAVKPLFSVDIKRVTTDPQVVAVRSRMSRQWLLFLPKAQEFITKRMVTMLMNKRDEKIISGTGTGTDIQGIIANSSAYTLTTIHTTNGNNSDAVMASYAQCRSLNQYPTHLFVNPIDAANVKISKTTTGEYVFSGMDRSIPYGEELIVIETNEVPVGYFVLGDMSKYNLRDVTDILITLGYDGTDLSTNMVTVIVEQFLVTWVTSIDKTAFVYDSYANVKTAIA